MCNCITGTKKSITKIYKLHVSIYTENKMLTFILKKEWYNKAFFRLGYTKGQVLEAWITKLEILDGKDTDLHINKPVYAIHFELTGQYGIQLFGNKGQKQNKKSEIQK